MLNTKLRRQIEWHFLNYEADRKLFDEKSKDIIYGNAVTSNGRIGSSSGTGDPTAKKAVKLWELEGERNWAAVVRNTFLAFRFEPELDLMTRLYIKKESWQSILGSGFPERTYWYWRDRWLEVALMWAREYGLINAKNIDYCKNCAVID